MKAAIREAYGDQISAAVLGNWSGQLWRFLEVMQVGDLVVMPLKKTSDSVAIGYVEGPYFYDADQPAGMRHSRPIRWVRPVVAKSELGSDLLASLGSLLTVCELSRRNIAARLAQVAEGHDDPGAQMQDYDPLPANVGELVDVAPRSMTVRELLDLWGFRRRTARIVEEVTDDLAELGLLAVPSIAAGWIDSLVEVIPVPGQTGEASESASAVSEAVDVAEATAEAVIGGAVHYSVSTMDTALCEVMSARPDDLLAVAVTNMALKDYSQIAVVDADDRLIGAVSWESIALAWMSGSPKVVRDAMRSAPSAAPEDELLQQAEVIYQHGFVLVRTHRGEVQGIITSADLSRRFGNDHRPIVLLDEIERRLSSRIMGYCTTDDLKDNGVHVPLYGATLGTYVTALSKAPLWSKLMWQGLAQGEFHEQLERVRVIRNQLMHFSPDPITADDIEVLEKTARVLRLVTSDRQPS
ncbi:restriction system protein [Cellulomonas sp. PhB150]|nr:restriction system protein [Cellulomonas sp. PhB150]